MLSIKVAVFLVILVGLVIVGINSFSRFISMNSFVGWCLSLLMKSKLWSIPTINLLLSSILNFFSHLL